MKQLKKKEDHDDYYAKLLNRFEAITYRTIANQADPYTECWREKLASLVALNKL